VRPVGGPSLSVMVIGRRWEPPLFDHSKFGGAIKHEPLSDQDRHSVLCAFRAHRGMMR